jgi:hypothetical protein
MRSAGGPLIGCIRPIELPAVDTVTLAVDADDPLSVMEPGATEQVDCAGAPLQLNVTV